MEHLHLHWRIRLMHSNVISISAKLQCYELFTGGNQHLSSLSDLLASSKIPVARKLASNPYISASCPLMYHFPWAESSGFILEIVLTLQHSCHHIYIFCPWMTHHLAYAQTKAPQSYSCYNWSFLAISSFHTALVQANVHSVYTREIYIGLFY